MGKKQNKPPTMDELVRLLADIFEESDRSYALIMSAWLDDAVGEIIRAQFIEHSTSADELLTGDAPLATFSARTKIAYCLRLIDGRVKRDLDTIRSVRNEFAHQRDNISFSSPSVVSKCANFALITEIRSIISSSADISPRTNFMLVSSHLLIYLLDRPREITRPQYDATKSLDKYLANRRAMEPGVKRLVASAKEKAAQDKLNNQ